jgi:glycosyltransferase involved in cell wall biosynthesis
VHTALNESFGITLIEAMSGGLPVFAAPVGGIPEIFDDGVQGRYLPLDDSKGAADILIASLGEEISLMRMARAAREKFIDKFESRDVAARLLGFLFYVA